MAAFAARGAILQAIGVIWRAAPDVRPPAREVPIRAYWLPYEADKTHEMMLGADANYFFTAGLSGCSVIVSGDPTAPRVAHINRTEESGDVFNRVVKAPRAAEDVIAQQRARATGGRFYSRVDKEAQTSRQLMFQELKTKVAARAAGRDTAGDLLGYCKWGEQYHSLACVMGVRNVASGAWTFHYQRYVNTAAPADLAHLGFITRREGPLTRIA